MYACWFRKCITMAIRLNVFLDGSVLRTVRGVEIDRVLSSIVTSIVNYYWQYSFDL